MQLQLTITDKKTKAQEMFISATKNYTEETKNKVNPEILQAHFFNDCANPELFNQLKEWQKASLLVKVIDLLDRLYIIDEEYREEADKYGYDYDDYDILRELTWLIPDLKELKKEIIKSFN